LAQTAKRGCPDPDHSLKLKEEIIKKPKNREGDDLRAQYDLGQLLKGAVQGKYAKRFHAGTNLVLLDPEVHRVFRSERAVNDALRLVELRKIGRGVSAPR
jgi:hypothetical protein